MPTFVSLSKPSRFTLYARPIWSAEVRTSVLKSKWGLEVSPGAEFGLELLSGKEAGTLVQELGPTQRARANLGTIRPTKYQVLIAVNPALQEVCTVQAPQLVEPGEEVELTLFLQAHKTLDLSDVQWLARAYLIE